MSLPDCPAPSGYFEPLDDRHCPVCCACWTPRGHCYGDACLGRLTDCPCKCDDCHDPERVRHADASEHKLCRKHRDEAWGNANL